MADIQVSSEQIQATAAKLATGHSTLKDTYSSLSTDVQTLVDEGWKGAASTSFHEAWQKYNNGANQMLSALQDIHNGMVATANTYSETEAQLSKGWA